MKSTLVKIGVMLISILCMGLSQEVLARETPVAMLTQVKGTIEYSHDGSTWKKVRRNKFLFDGNLVRSGADGTAKLMISATNMGRDMGNNTQIKITNMGGELISGQLSESTPVGGDLVASLSNRFSKAQKYTTVRRAISKKQDLKLATAREVTLSEAYPELVWEGMGEGISYRLNIDKESHIIQASSEPIIRFKVPTLAAGDHDYSVELLSGNDTLFTPKKGGKIRWLSAEDMAAVESGLKTVQNSAPGDDFMVASYLEDQGLLVAAMDMYRKYFAENADDVDTYPMLIKSYYDLKLNELKKAEAAKYNKMLDAGEG
ncbi:MAG: hypothetical protein HQL67_00140 [Magnetococcales bacterium]|nr:hypothetical protein [Magnetococcales bacterium]